MLNILALFDYVVFCFCGDKQMASKKSRGNSELKPHGKFRHHRANKVQLTPHCLLQQSASVGQRSSRHIDKLYTTARHIGKPHATAAHAAELTMARPLPGTQRRSHDLLEPSAASPP